MSRPNNNGPRPPRKKKKEEPNPKWTPSEDELLMSHFKQYGTKYSKIKEKLEGRSEIKIKIRINFLNKGQKIKYEDSDDDTENATSNGNQVSSGKYTFNNPNFDPFALDWQHDADLSNLFKLQVLHIGRVDYKVFKTLNGFTILVPLSFGIYTFVKMLNHGSYSVVVLVREETTQKEFAAKFISKEFLKKSGSDDDIMGELAIKYLHHENIVAFHDFYNLQDCYVIITVFYPNGDFLDLFCKNLERFDEKKIIWYIKQIIKAVCYLHMKGISHGDLKFENFLVDINFNLILTDFGFSQWKTHKKNIPYGSVGYRPPEMANFPNVDRFKVDIYELGIVLYKIYQSTGSKNEQLLNLAMSCLDPNPENRITVYDIQNHPLLVNA